MSEIEYEPSGNSNSSFQVGAEFIVVVCRLNAFPGVVNT